MLTWALGSYCPGPLRIPPGPPQTPKGPPLAPPGVLQQSQEPRMPQLHPHEAFRVRLTLTLMRPWPGVVQESQERQGVLQGQLALMQESMTAQVGRAS